MTSEDSDETPNNGIRRLIAEWQSLPPALQASYEGETASLSLLLTNAVTIARMMRDELGEVDPGAEASILIALCSRAYQLNIQPEPSPDICHVLAAAAIRVMDLEDLLAVRSAEVEILRTDDDE